ncbi:DNA fragmentation factor subunit beta isoform X2 [Octopus bimaculoides]|uniref:DNA fragmentation factor subunit beta isoform X2 n=1 Tax=Octopus bimaculoides TaxID=37653 RepID=UPI0022E232BE|nr:DNA fragmentation factor subunit beta isoform X2 [Octopus bimaculoides]
MHIYLVRAMMDANEVRVVLEDDGTLVDSSYFKRLPPQTVFVLLRKDEKWSGIMNMIQNIFKADGLDLQEILKSDAGDELLEKIKKVMKETQDDRSCLELRSEDENWFADVKKTFKRKSEYMNYKAQSRVKKYYSDASAKLRKDVDQEISKVIQKLIDQLKTKLEKNSYQGAYFDRTASETERICDSDGWFNCEGKFDENTCKKSHKINPYSTRENCMLFALWDLDHIIEKTRVVIPMVLKAAKMKKTKQILSCDKIYNLLFTRQNLKLVYKECHDKKSRVSTLDWNTLYL